MLSLRVEVSCSCLVVYYYAIDAFRVNIRICHFEKVMSTEAKVDKANSDVTEKDHINCFVL